MNDPGVRDEGGEVVFDDSLPIDRKGGGIAKICQVTPWDPNEWEQHIQKVLKLRYGQPVGSYQHIADEIKGDSWIEGFAVDGTAYQCYACQNWTDFGVLIEHQKNKMTLDIGKLLRNEAELLRAC